MQHVLVALQVEKSSCYNTSIFAVSLLGCPPCFGCPGPSPRLNLPLCMPEFEPPPLHARVWTSPSARYWERWATFRKLESRMGKSGFVNHVRNWKI